MGQCVSQPHDPQLRPRHRRPKLSSLRTSLSKRVRFMSKHRQDPPERSSVRPPPVEQPTTSTGQPLDVPGDDRGVITPPMQGTARPAHFGPPRPQIPQGSQESDNDDQEDEPYEFYEPGPDVFPEDVDEGLFRERLGQMLLCQMKVKDQEFPTYKEPKVKTQYRGFQEPKRVLGESIPMTERHPEPDLSQTGSTYLEHYNQPSTSEQSSTESTYFGVQDIGEHELHDQGKLAAGRSGLVHLARWHGADVAVKIFYSSHPDEGERAMQQETKTLSMLKHPSVVTLYGRCFFNRNPAIVLEYVTGGSLRSTLLKLRREKGRMSALNVKTKVQIALQAANAMKYLHSRNVIHFDIKAENFLCDLRELSVPIVKVADVGLSKHKIASLVSGSMRGTLPWMAPELFPQMPRGEQIGKPYTPHQVNNKVDVYSFGIVMWEIWTVGSEPYHNMSANDVLYRILGGYLRPAIPRDCNDLWSRLMQACWDTDPDERPSFRTITDSLEDMLKRI